MFQKLPWNYNGVPVTKKDTTVYPTKIPYVSERNWVGSFKNREKAKKAWLERLYQLYLDGIVKETEFYRFQGPRRGRGRPPIQQLKLVIKPSPSSDSSSSSDSDSSSSSDSDSSSNSSSSDFEESEIEVGEIEEVGGDGGNEVREATNNNDIDRTTKKIKELTEEENRQKENHQKKKVDSKSLSLFGLTSSDLGGLTCAIIKKKFKKLLLQHPDKNGGEVGLKRKLDFDDLITARDELVQFIER